MIKKSENNISYIFYVQSVEDFYNQLREFELEDRIKQLKVDTENLDLAQNMLNSIGVQCK